MSDSREKLDRFESVFKGADRPRFKLAPVDYTHGVVVSDRDRAATDAMVGQVQSWLSTLTDACRITWTGLSKDDLTSVSALRKSLIEHKADLIVTYRNLFDPQDEFAHSLGVYLDELTQVLPAPIVVLPDPGSVPDESNPKSVMVISDHLAGEDRLLNKAIRFTDAGGKLILTHIEDDYTFERYMSAIERIPDLNTDLVRDRLKARLLTDPAQYIETCVEVIEAAGLGIEVEAVVEVGHRVTDYRRIVDEHNVDLLIMNTNDETQVAMHGLAYPIAVEFRDLPIIML